jgi:hypothetical protein
MVRIEVNGIAVEAETLAGAQKLARKEERRQAEARKARVALNERAYYDARASLGYIASVMGRSGKPYLYDIRKRSYSQDGLGRTQYAVHTRYGSGYLILSPNVQLTCEIEQANGETMGLRVVDDAQVYWWAVGAANTGLNLEEGEAAVWDIPPSMAQELERQWQAQHGDQQAA